jgi:DDE superfamily endonuclease
MIKLLPNWIRVGKWSAFGGNASLNSVSMAWKNVLDRVALGRFPPELVVQIKAIACELPAKYGIALSRWSTEDIVHYVRQSGLVATISGSSVWRWLHEDAIKPWQHRCWIFPRDPNFAAKAGRILDLYHRVWNGRRLKEDEFVLSADEKTSIQARARRHSTYCTQPGSPMKVEHEYKRCGAWAYIAALDVHRAKLFGLCNHSGGILPFDRLVEQVMSQAPYKQARRVFWIVDNGSAHRGLKSVERLQGRYANLTLVHSPLHASWLNQIEIYFSILQRKALTPNDFPSLEALRERILGFQQYYEEILKPFEWNFTRKDLNRLMFRMNNKQVESYRLAA